MSRLKHSVSSYILHSRPYQESSLIFQLFSREFGRFSVIAKGIKGKRSQARRAVLQPFRLLNLTFAGKSELKTLTEAELAPGQELNVFGGQEQAMTCAYYANELIIRALPEQQEQPELFNQYVQLLEKLQAGGSFDRSLRQFEMALLMATGVAPDCRTDTRGDPISPAQHYLLLPQRGFCPASQAEAAQGFSGSAVLALAGEPLSQEDRGDARRITRTLLQEIIGSQPLQSRKLWQHMRLNQNREISK